MHLIRHALPSHLHTPLVTLYPCLNRSVISPSDPAHPAHGSIKGLATPLHRPNHGRPMVAPWTFSSGSIAASGLARGIKGPAGFTLVRPCPAAPATSFLGCRVVGAMGADGRLFAFAALLSDPAMADDARHSFVEAP